jgi:uncharacterized protein with NRDE domain
MCLILIAHDIHPHYRLILAANRDEFYSRPTFPAQFWYNNRNILAGQDQVNGGTWLGVNRRGHWAALTNFRNQDELKGESGRSRGLLVSDYLESGKKPLEFLSDLTSEDERYRGYNLLVSNGFTLDYFSNRGEAPQELAPGYYGLSNHLLDTPWEKLRRAKAEFVKSMETGLLNELAIFDLLADTTQVADDQLPDTGFGPEWERILSARFIQSELYGTRCSTLLLIDREGWVTFVERTYNHSPEDYQDVRFLFKSKN